MLSRKVMLFLSFVTALVLYAGLYAVAPRIFLIRANSTAERHALSVRVDLIDEETARRFESPADAVDSMASRPGSVRDLLDRETQDLPLAEPEFPPVEDAASLAERLMQEGTIRDHDLDRDEDIAAGIDARIVEISQESARSGIDVVRRLVRPSPVRVLERDEILRAGGAGRTRTGAILGLPASETSSSAAVLEGTGESTSASGGGALDASVLAPKDQEIFLSELEVPMLPLLPDETLLGAEFIRRAIERDSPFERMDRLVGIEASTYVDPSNGEGFFRLKIFPKDAADVEILPKDVTFLVDASNSILQRKLDLTVRGLKACFTQMRPGDRFNIVVFRDTPRRYREEFSEVTQETIADAIVFLEGIRSKGSTNVYDAVRSVIGEPPREGLPGIVIVLSDGRPTAGNLTGRDLINALTAENVHGNTIFTFGGGKTVNRYLMDLLAYSNKGMSWVTDRVEDIDDELPKFFRQINDAILVELRADYGRIDEETIFPRALPDFYRGRVVTVYGRFEPGRDKELVLRLQGRAGLVQKDMVLKASLAAATQGDRSIARGWAFEKSYYLIGEVTRLGEQPELMSELRALSRQYDIRTSYFP